MEHNSAARVYVRTHSDTRVLMHSRTHADDGGGAGTVAGAGAGVVLVPLPVAVAVAVPIPVHVAVAVVVTIAVTKMHSLYINNHSKAPYNIQILMKSLP